ncbi:hypothetical protein BC938DRAFT_474715 [Jimgerdemannia flammicorona]|uniref:N-acetyltransferase domain-containing protein n=1 Tax=Jimgerdemannia flammicorona TaxID=994334 RepID=A0A433Q1N5_9FUNG|nr:hypothetical protein BC938DRAFT_474715 [Jimgerdemannia flammicorona]
MIISTRSSDLDLIIDYYTARDLPDPLKEWTYDLVKSNMYTLYANSKDGWNEAEKRSDMGDEASRYLIARDRADPGRPVGFVMFQFVREETMDDEMVVEVAYWYVYIV